MEPPANPRTTQPPGFCRGAGDGPRGLGTRPSSIKRDCDRRPTSTVSPSLNPWVQRGLWCALGGSRVDLLSLGCKLSGMRVPRGPLRSRNFRLLQACNVISVAGTAVAIAAIPFAVLAIGGSAADVGYVAAAVMVPALIFPLGGVVADRLPRHQVMMAANVLQAAAQAAAAALVLAGRARVWELVVLALARGVGYAFYFPAEAGLLPQTVPADQRAAANAMDRTGRGVSQIGGSALGGVLVGLAGPGWGPAVDAASFAVAAALRAGMRFPDLPPVAKTGMPGELREGWRDVISRRWFWPIVLALGFIVAVSATATSVLGPLVAHAQLGGARSWGIILAAYAAGAVLGGMIMLRFRPQPDPAGGDAAGTSPFGVPLRAGRAPAGGLDRRNSFSRGRLPPGVLGQLGHGHAAGNPASQAVPPVLL